MIKHFFSQVKQRYYGIGFKLLTITSLLILCSIVLVSSLSYYKYTMDFQQQSSERTYQTISQLSYNLDNYLDELFQLSKTPYYNSTLMNELTNDHPSTTFSQLQKTWYIEGQLNSMITSRSDILSAYIISDNIIYRGGIYTEGIDSKVNYSQYDWYQQAMSQNNAIYVPTHLEELITNPNFKVFSIVRCINNIQTGKPLGVLKIDADYTAIQSLCDQIDTGKDGGLLIEDQNNSIIYSSIKSQNIDALYKLVQNKSNHSLTTSIKGKKYLLDWVVIPSAKWTIISLSSVSELNKNAVQTRNATFIMALICSMSAIIILAFFTKTFLRPLLQIVLLMKDVQKGNFKIKFPEGRNDEIGYLGSSFNTMVFRISSMIDENDKLIRDVYESKLLQNEAQINALYSQIRPHFMFNTLNMISLLIRSGKNDIAIDSIDKLSDLLRCMAHFNKEITIAEELQLLNSYLSIQGTRYNDRLEYLINIDNRFYKYVIPALIFQPIVENTIIHGCEKCREKTTINIYSLLQDNFLIICIEDNANGMNKEELELLREKVYNLEYNNNTSLNLGLPDMSNGIGLVNVNKRIKIKFGNQYGLIIDSEENKGTCIKVLLPKPLNMEEL